MGSPCARNSSISPTIVWRHTVNRRSKLDSLSGSAAVLNSAYICATRSLFNMLLPQFLTKIANSARLHRYDVESDKARVLTRSYLSFAAIFNHQKAHNYLSAATRSAAARSAHASLIVTGFVGSEPSSVRVSLPSSSSFACSNSLLPSKTMSSKSARVSVSLAVFSTSRNCSVSSS